MVNQISVDHGVTAALHDYDAVHRDRLLSGEVFGWQKDQFAFMEIMSFILANQRKADPPRNPRPGADKSSPFTKARGNALVKRVNPSRQIPSVKGLDLEETKASNW